MLNALPKIHQHTRTGLMAPYVRTSSCPPRSSGRLGLALITAFFAIFLVDMLLHLRINRLPSWQAHLSHDLTQCSDPAAADWSRFAYLQYTMSTVYLCNSLMLFSTLHRLGSKAERLLLYPSYFTASDSGKRPHDINQRLLRKAKESYGVKLQPEVQTAEST